MNGKATAILLALGCAVLFAAALPRFRAEYAAVLFTRMTADQQLFALAEGGVHLPSSIRAERAVLRACDAALASPLGLFQPQETRAALQANCASLAREAHDRSPTSSWAHLAVAAAAQTDADFGQAIVRSQATGAYEGELAQRRFALGISRLERGDDALKSALAADVAVLAQFSAGRAQLVQSYLAYPEQREFIASASEKAPDEAQRAFIQALRKAGG